MMERSEASPQLGFLSLPPEIRNQIYGYLFKDAKLGVSIVHPHSYHSHSRSQVDNAHAHAQAQAQAQSQSQVHSSRGPTREQGQVQGRIRPCRSNTFCTCTFPVALTTTCRLVRAETLHLLLAATTLEIAAQFYKTALLPDRFRNTISRAVVLDAKQFGWASGGKGSGSGRSAVLPATPTLTAMSRLPFEQFESLRVLELRNLCVWCKYYDEAYLESPDADECMVNLAMFNLRRISPALIELCENQNRPFTVLLGCLFVGNSIRHETVHAMIDIDTKEILTKSRGASVRDRNEWAGFY